MSSSPSSSGGTTQDPVFTAKDCCLFRLLKMINTVATAALLFVLNWSTKHVKDETVTYWYFFTAVESLSWTRMKNEFKFDATMRNIMQTKPPELFDVSLLSACIRCACRTRTDAQGLFNHVKAIKDFRNTILHEGLDDSSCFRPKTNDLEQFIKDLVNTAQSVFNIPADEVSGVIMATSENINKICSEKFSLADMAEYRNKYLLEKLQSVGLANLQSFYKQLEYITPLHYLNENIPMLVSMVYIQLEIVEAGKGSSGHQVMYTDLFQNVTSHPGGEPSNKAKVILVEGPSGVGKTTLTRLLINGWNEGDSNIEGLEDFDFVLYVECRMPHIEKFSELLASLMPDVAVAYDGEEMLKCLLRRKVLVIVDGLDEMNPSSRKLFQEILYSTRTSNLIVLATTRAEALKLYYRITPEGTRTTHIKIIGIPENKREEFAIRYHEEMKKTRDFGCDTKGLVRYLRRMGVNLTEYWRIPLHLGKLVMLWVLWPDIVNAVTTVTELFKETEVLIDEELADRVVKNNKCVELLPEDITEKINDHFRPELYRIALYGQREEGLILSDKSEKTLKKLCEDLALPYPQVLGAFFVQRSMWTKTGTITKYSYSHRGTQDFYSALHIQDVIKNETDETCSGGRIRNVLKDVYKSDPENFNLKKFQEVLVHLISLLYIEGEMSSQEASEEVVQLLEESGVNDKQAWLDILSNVKANDTITSLVSKYVPDVLNLKSHATITDSQALVYSKLITRANPQKITVSLQNSPSSVPGLQDLFQSMYLLTCEMEVYFHEEFQQPSTATSTIDPILLKLFEECSITKYMGCARKNILAGCPDSVEMLYMSAADQSQLEDLMSTVVKLTQLKWLCIHAATGVDLRSQPALSTMNHVLYEGKRGSSVRLTIRKPTDGPFNKAHLEDLMANLCKGSKAHIEMHLRKDWSLVADHKFITLITTSRSSLDLLELKEVKTLLMELGNSRKKFKLNFKYEPLQRESIVADDVDGASSFASSAKSTPQYANLLQDLISSLSMSNSDLCIHVMPEVDPSTLRPCTVSKAPSLVLPNLEDASIPWAIQVMRTLKHDSTYRYLILPEVNLSEAGYRELLRAVRLKWHVVAPSSWPARIGSANLQNITLEKLKCDLILMSKEELMDFIKKMDL